MGNVEKQIADEIAAANGLKLTELGLRFDKVVVRLLGNLRAYVRRANLNYRTLCLTITAPIKLAAKTQHEVEKLIDDSLTRKKLVRDRQITVFQNKVRMRIVESASDCRFIGLVHNPNIDSRWLLDLAAKWLIGTES